MRVPLESVSVYSYLPGFGGVGPPARTGAAVVVAAAGALVGAALLRARAALGAGVVDGRRPVAGGAAVAVDNAVFEVVVWDGFLVATNTTDRTRTTAAMARPTRS